jgi:hypothetical protein
MSSRTISLHADWLSLVEPEGQFLSLPVLKRAFPDGLGAIPTAIREQLRDRYPHDVAPLQTQWDAWSDWLLRDALSWGPYYRTGEDVAACVHAVPEQGIVLRADAALCDPEADKPRVLVARYPRGTPLDRRLAGERWNASPIDRMTLLCRAQGVRIGLLTDGENIILVWVPTTGVGGYATWNTSLFTESRERNLLQSFTSLLHASRFFAVQNDLQLEALFEASEKAQNEVTGQLGLQVRQAVELLVAALSRTDLERGGALLAGIAPQTVYEAAATVMMRLVFLLYAEERDLLPLADPLYADFYAASTLREQLDDQAAIEGDEPLERRGAAWYRLLALFRVIYGGLSHDRLRLPPYGGRLFDPDRFAFLEGRIIGESWTKTASRPLPVDDLTVRAILEAIQTLPIRDSGSKERRRLSFRSLDVEQIGHVYEGLLDHGAVRVDDLYVGLVGKTGDEAEIPLVDLEEAAQRGTQPLVAFLHDFTGKSESAVEKLIERGQAVARGEDSEARRLVNTVCDNNAALANRVSPFVYTLRTDLHGLPVVFAPKSLVVKQTRARRDSGTEYTPRELAEEMVRYALEPLVYSPGPRDGIQSDQWRLRPSKELLDLKICDPAVGSGAFLVSACRYLADRIVEAWIFEDPKRAKVDAADLTLEARRVVVDRCLYGVDRDPMAVEMAKLSLWLITMGRERPFSFLDHSIREGDSLLGITSLDQLRFLHIDPEIGRALHKKMLVDVTAIVQPLVAEATALRQELESRPTISVRDSEKKQRLNDQANLLLETVNIIANGIVATSLSTATVTEQRLNAAFQGLASLVASCFDPSESDAERLDKLDRLRSRNEQMLNMGRPDTAPPRTTLHWVLAFPEAFGAPRSGFDAIVGNPPFMGGKKISGAFGSDYREYLVTALAEGRKGNADLVSFFFLRAASLGESLGFLAVNTIAQGDTREVGLDALAAQGWRIVRAVKSRPWPGAAGVHIAQVWLSRHSELQCAVLDDLNVKEISPRLSAAGRVMGNPFRLVANAGIAFQGLILLGTGFTMSPEEAAELIRKDPRNSDVLLPYLNADDLCSRPNATPSRWIVNFHEWPIERAMEFTECFAYVEQRVKIERSAKKGAVYEQARAKWWWFWNRRPAMQAAISSLERVIVMPQISKIVLPVFEPKRMGFDQKVVVFARDDYHTFSVLSSTIHRNWARQYSGTLKAHTSYAPTDCFATYPLPERKIVGRVAQDIDDLRAFTMSSDGVGLTKLYNRVHDQHDNDRRIVELRSLHAELDRLVCDAYGWTDLDLGYGFHETDEGIRWTVDQKVRNESLDRLLELNHDRHREEIALGLAKESNANGHSKRGRGENARSNGNTQLVLTSDNDN